MKTPDEISRHEVGHVLAAALYGARPFSLSLDSDGEGSGGRIHFRQRTIYTAEDCRKSMRIWLAGVASERILTGTPLQPIGPDGDESWRLARVLHGLDAGDDVIQAEVDDQLAAVEVLLRQHWQAVVDLADASRQWFNSLDKFRMSILEAGEVEVVDSHRV